MEYTILETPIHCPFGNVVPLSHRIYAKYSHEYQIQIKGKSEIAANQGLTNNYRGGLIEHRSNHQYVTCAP